jgi:cytochrome c biogenesis protein CcmG/thiol:disulfide interchange protein DsbE
MWRYAVPVVALLVLGVFFYRGLYLNPGYIESPLIGKQAPEFSLPDLENPAASVGTADLSGKVSLLNVWATWCVECRHEHDFLLRLAASGMPIYGLNWKDDRAAALQWLETLGDPYVASATDEIGDVAIDYGVYGAPETFLIGPDLTILQKHLGPLTPAIWDAKFAPMIESARGNR